jgi:hypothetical protein
VGSKGHEFSLCFSDEDLNRHPLKGLTCYLDRRVASSPELVYTRRHDDECRSNARCWPAEGDPNPPRSASEAADTTSGSLSSADNGLGSRPCHQSRHCARLAIGPGT